MPHFRGTVPAPDVVRGVTQVEEVLFLIVMVSAVVAFVYKFYPKINDTRSDASCRNVEESFTVESRAHASSWFMRV